MAYQPDDKTLLRHLLEFGNRFLDVTDGLDQRIETLEDHSTYVHQQLVAAKTWNVTHSLGHYPSVTVVDSAGSKIVGDVHYTGIDSVTIDFSAEFAGTAYFN